MPVLERVELILDNQYRRLGYILIDMVEIIIKAT